MTIVFCGESKVSLQRLEALVAVPAPPVMFEFLEVGKKGRPFVVVVDPFTGSKSFKVHRDYEVIGRPVRIALTLFNMEVERALMTDEHFIHDLILHQLGNSLCSQSLEAGRVVVAFAMRVSVGDPATGRQRV
ncbi:hypothetical protein ARTHRO9V_90198 [Arthrobacter sp. 9V]|nr:hypothetical protein ARTHRO9V_90198 [Arthrobacter sp. 9V]